jgi:integrase/recombinase XerD
VSEACNAQVTDLCYAGGYELLRVVGKGAKPAEIPLPVPVLRAVKAAIEGRSRGPILRSAKGKALTRGAASRLLRRVVR